MVKDIVVALLTTTINRYSELKIVNVSRDVICMDLTTILDYVGDIPEDSKRPVTVVLNEGDCKCEIYKQVLEEVLSNLRSIDSPNPADSYIDESIEMIKKVMEETKWKAMDYI